ncbi:MAG TPA: ABC transporter ATP-binding protein [Solirubrobacterales bacterium]|nr:ABC transporter ATP-binding protein [Solirubrobacterales bacterium]
MVRTEAKDFAAVSGSPPDARDAGASVSIRGLRHRYGELTTIERLDLEVPGGTVLGLVGPSGCGKSTLLELLCGLQEPAAGEIDVRGARGAAERLTNCAFMPQRDVLLPWLSALDNAALAPRNRGAGRRRARAEAAELFERFGLAGFERALPRELSGGMRQRVAFLRTLLSRKPVLALDEPFASLDAITRAEMQGWLAHALDEDPHTVVLVTHDVEEALYLSDRLVVLSARPARVVDEIVAPAPRAAERDAAVTDPSFVVLRERAMAALREGMR